LTILGAAIGSIFGGPFSDNYGRKNTILFADVLFTGGAILMGLAPTIPVLMLGRLIIGFGVGIASMIVPTYLAESAPVEIRGKLVTFYVLNITGGQLISYGVCLGLGTNWRLMLGLAGVFSFF
jgi:SP family myo-inositol transporter-like MFS transporter 13